VCGTADLEIGWGYVKQLGIVGDDPLEPWERLRTE
jgi:hypothetical protein